MTGQVFCVRQVLGKKLEYTGTVHHLFVDFMKTCDYQERATAQHSDWIYYIYGIS
jgi:ribosomal protein S19E (S16A)